jgi:hypothetical protein
MENPTMNMIEFKRTVRMSEASFTVVGVLSPEFRPLARSEGSVVPEIYIPLGYALVFLAASGRKRIGRSRGS